MARRISFDNRQLLRRSLTVVVVIINSLFCPGAVEEGVPIIRNFTENDYRGGGKIYSLFVTEKGLLYAGDKSGLIEFDGENWNRIDCGFAVNSIVADSGQNVYIAGDMGIGRIVVDSANRSYYESLNNLLSIDNRLRDFSNARVFSVDNKIVSVIGNEIVINSPERIRIIEAPHSFKYYQKLGNRLFLYSSTGGVYRFEDDELSIVSAAEIIKNKDVRGFYYAGGKLFMVTNEDGIVSFEGEKIIYADNELSEFVSGCEVRGIDQLDDSTYALSTFYKGLCIFDNNQVITRIFEYSNGLANNTILSVVRDMWNNLWIGTSAGISVIRLDSPFKEYDTREGLGTGYSATIYKGELYLGTSQGLYRKVNRGKGEKYEEIIRGHIWGLHKVGDYLYFGHARGLYLWDNSRIKEIYRAPSGWQIRRVPGYDNFFVTNTFSGLLLLRLNSGGILEPAGIIEGSEYRIRNFEFDSENRLWAEFQNGIISFKLTDDNLRAEEINRYDRIEAGNNLRKVCKISDKLYFIADSGVYSYNRSEAGFEQSSLFYDLAGRGVIPSNIIADSYSRIWLFSQGKLSLYRLEEGILKNDSHTRFDYYDNSYPQDYENIFCIDQARTVIGREQGFWCYDNQVDGVGVYSSTIIRRVLISSKKGDIQSVWGSENFSGKNYILELNSNILHRYNSLKFYFSAGCSNYDNVKYQTHLAGYDDKWSDWNYESIREYTNLPPGDYQFVIRSVNRGREFGYVATCRFTISPPWYLTTVAMIIYGIIIIILVIGTEKVIRYRARRVQEKIRKTDDERKQREEQERVYEDLKREKESFSYRNEKLRIDNLYKSKELANSTMSIIKKNQFLTELKSELELIRKYAEGNKVITPDINKVISKIDRDIDNEENWKVFEDYFDIVHENFLSRIKQKYPILSSKDLRLSSYIRMNLSSKEIAPLLNITTRGVEISRYRLRKKLGLGRDDNLNDFLHKL